MVEVWIKRYSDSNPMIDGVRILLLVTVWNATVAIAWHHATTAIAVTALARRCAISHHPRVPTSSGLP